MNSQLSELEIVQNPALGAYALWQFGLGFQADDSRPATLPLFFLVLPLLFHRQTLQMIGSTRKSSGLALLAAKLGEERENLLAVHGRARLLRALTLESIGLGIHSKLLSVDYAEATVRANSPSKLLRRLTLPERLKPLPLCADKIGYWFSKSGLNQVASTLKVDF
jgi:Family of unknown function (DUF6521)